MRSPGHRWCPGDAAARRARCVAARDWPCWPAALVTSSAFADALLVVRKSEHAVDFVEPGTGARLMSVDVGFTPHEIGVSPDGRRAIVTNYGTTEQPGHTVSLLDLEQPHEIARIDLGRHTRPHGVAWYAPDRVAVTNEGSRHLLILDPGARRIVAEIPTDQSVSHMVVVTRDGARAFVTNIDPARPRSSTCRAHVNCVISNGRRIGRTRPVTRWPGSLGCRADRRPGDCDRCVDAGGPPSLGTGGRANPDRADTRWSHGAGELRRDRRGRGDRHESQAVVARRRIELAVAAAASARGAANLAQGGVLPVGLVSRRTDVPPMSRRRWPMRSSSCRSRGLRSHKRSRCPVSRMDSVVPRCYRSSMSRV